MTHEEVFQYLLKTVHDCMPDLDVSGFGRDPDSWTRTSIPWDSC